MVIGIVYITITTLNFLFLLSGVSKGAYSFEEWNFWKMPRPLGRF